MGRTRTPRILDAVDVRQHEDVEQFGAGCLGEGVEVRLQLALEFVRSHGCTQRVIR